MPTISSYALQLSTVNFTAISTSTFDLFITEGAPLAPGGGFPAITDTQVAQLRGQGRTVVGYVNVAVTDDARYYWNSSWTSNGHDTGTPIQGQAPSWLDQAVPLDFDLDNHQDALIVEYWDPAWQQIVIDQAVALVQRGYSGVYLDNVGIYFRVGEVMGNTALMADRMMDLIHAVRTAITAVNPNAVVVTNTNPYIGTDSSGGGFGAKVATYRADVDFHLIENQGTAALDHFATYFAGEPLLILQSVTPAPLTYDQAWSRGILYTAPNTGYNSLGTFAYPATAGADNLAGGDGPNQISGLGGNDYLNGGAGADTLSGNGGDDIFIVDNAGDVTVEASGQGRDVVYASVNYSLAAGSHIEVLSTISQAAATAMTLIGNELVNEIYGNAGANFIDGGGGADYLAAFGGDDIYIVDAAGDVVAEAASEGRDVVYAKASWALGAGSSVEVLSTISSGATTAINLTGNALDNELYGNAGANTLNGGAGADYLMGYGGSDNFAFTTALGGGNIDQIADFNAAADTILLDDAVFAALPAGALNANAFVVGTTAQDSTDRIVYDSATGNLYYDADGSGAGAAVLFATLVGHPTITASDFTVI
ncbi:MAG: hypothetical protein E6G92_08080 [Alphaproteobacteria bacterium]|nr:MAG: hypothetical protein E6G92_08080 [Alphaproteobacteria bacterium]